MSALTICIMSTSCRCSCSARASKIAFFWLRFFVRGVRFRDGGLLAGNRFYTCSTLVHAVWWARCRFDDGFSSGGAITTWLIQILFPVQRKEGDAWTRNRIDEYVRTWHPTLELMLFWISVFTFGGWSEAGAIGIDIEELSIRCYYSDKRPWGGSRHCRWCRERKDRQGQRIVSDFWSSDSVSYRFCSCFRKDLECCTGFLVTCLDHTTMIEFSWRSSSVVRWRYILSWVSLNTNCKIEQEVF